VNEQVLNVTNFLSDHPGGELAILTFAGKDATEEFNMIHPPDVIPKYAPDAIIGVVGTGAATGPAPGAGSGGGGGGKMNEKGSVLANHQAWGHYEGQNWRIEGLDHNPGVLIVNVKAYIGAAWYLILAMLYEVCATIFTAKNIKLSNDRVGLTRSAIFLVFFIVIHAVGNLHVFKGPDDFNGYGYFYVRLYWTGFGLPANIVEEYILLAALLHAFVGLKRTWDMKLAMGLKSGALNLAITGLMLLTFMTIHLFQFRFGDTDQFGAYYIRPPTFLINFKGILSLDLFWTDDTSVTPVGVRDIYALEYQIFKNPFWGAFYICAVLCFMAHACMGWKKVTPALGIPKGHHKRVEVYGYIIFLTLGAIYISFPLYCLLTDRFNGKELTIQTRVE
jgi:succinate dehydrogenase hydrophobic anchor subunit